MDEFYTISEAARVLKVHPITIRRYIREGKLKAVRAVGNIRIPQADLKDFTTAFVPRGKPYKNSKSRESNFSFSDPLFRLKARGLGINMQDSEAKERV